LPVSARPIRCSALAILGALWLASPASAHPDANEDLLVLRPDGVTVAITLTIAEEDARALREQLGGDAQLGEWLAREAQRFARVELDGHAAPLALEASERAGRTIRVTLGASRKIARSVQFSDRRRDPKLTVSVRVEGAPPAAKLPPQPVVFEGHPLFIRLR
jgi:hypothetical protein